MSKKHPNMQRIPMTLFIPWDENGRVYLNDHEYITRETELRGGKVRRFREGIVIRGKK